MIGALLKNNLNDFVLCLFIYFKHFVNNCCTKSIKYFEMYADWDATIRLVFVEFSKIKKEKKTKEKNCLLRHSVGLFMCTGYTERKT